MQSVIRGSCPESHSLAVSISAGAVRLDGFGAKESPQRRGAGKALGAREAAAKGETMILAVALGSGSHIISNARAEFERAFESKARTL